MSVPNVTMKIVFYLLHVEKFPFSEADFLYLSIVPAFLLPSNTSPFPLAMSIQGCYVGAQWELSFNLQAFQAVFLIMHTLQSASKPESRSIMQQM